MRSSSGPTSAPAIESNGSATSATRPLTPCGACARGAATMRADPGRVTAMVSGSAPAGAPPADGSPNPWAPTSGTNRTGPRSSSSNPSPIRRTRTSSWPRVSGPTGMTSRPPSASCSSSASGTAGPPAVTTMASKGAASGYPSVPSPHTTWALS